MTRKILLGAEHSIVEPLALFHLSDIAKQEGWEPKIVLSKGPDYENFRKSIKEFRPDVFGLSLSTGNHGDIKTMFNQVKKENSNLRTVVGGPHPTYFPTGCLEYSDYVVVGEGFDSLRRILNGVALSGIVSVKRTEEFSSSNRKEFYEENPIHRENPIKSIVAGSGCFYNCAHCYNSNKMSDVPGLEAEQVQEMEKAIGAKRFFPARQRPLSDVLLEIEHVQKVAPETKMFFFQDDIFGGDIEWLRGFSEKYNARLPFHINMRYELVNPDTAVGRERVSLLKKSGCTGLTLAIESGDEHIRKELLKRNTPEDLILNATEYLGKNGFKVRTNQMIGLPYGATREKTKMNLEADLETLELSVRLKEQAGLPTIPWASTLAPYPGTKIAEYCESHGFCDESCDVVGGETYRTSSVLKHAKEWVGPTLSPEDDCWLDEGAQSTYRTQLKTLMDYFPIFGLIPSGHNVARDFLTKGQMGFKDIYNLMKKHDVFDKIHEGKKLEARLINQEDKSSSAINASVRHHVYDNDLFDIK